MSDSPEAKAGESGVDSLRAKAKLRGLLGSALRVTLSDGRAVTGRYQCMDEHLNVILREASERRGMGARAGVGAGSESVQVRQLGLVMLPGKHVVRVEVKGRDPLEVTGPGT
jgi:small nuclear ribonucleoprotein (snRNP)-like protein